MTLKEYFILHSINATPDQRSQIGVLLSYSYDSNKRVIENGWSVIDYREEFLKCDITIGIILNYFDDGGK